MNCPGIELGPSLLSGTLDHRSSSLLTKIREVLVRAAPSTLDGTASCFACISTAQHLSFTVHTGCGVGTSCNSLHVIRNYSDIVVVADIIIYYSVFENV